MRVSALCGRQIPLASFVQADKFASTNFPHIRVAATVMGKKTTDRHTIINDYERNKQLSILQKI